MVPPVIHPPRCVPEELCKPLKRELYALVEQDIIAKVGEPADWVNSLVCVTKANGSLQHVRPSWADVCLSAPKILPNLALFVLLV